MVSYNTLPQTQHHQLGVVLQVSEYCVTPDRHVGEPTKLLRSDVVVVEVNVLESVRRRGGLA